MFLAVLAFALPAACSVDAEPEIVVCDGEPELSDDLVRKPYLQSVTGREAVVVWGDRDLDGGVVHFAVPGRTLREADAETSAPIPSQGLPILLHTARLTGLEPDTEYCYAPARGSKVLARGLRFRTAAESEDATARFFVLGDYGAFIGGQRAVLEQMLARRDEADFWISTGDNAYPDGGWVDFEAAVFNVYGDLFHRLPFYPSPGNHDYKTLEATPYLANFVLPRQALSVEDQERYYSFDWGPVHFVSLDSEGALSRTSDMRANDMLDWLAADLAATKKPWKVAFFHHPPYTYSPKHGGDGDALEKIVPLLEAHGVQVVFNGHNHFYERSVPIRGGFTTATEKGGVTYVVTGGGGAFLYEVEPGPLQAVGIAAFHFVQASVDACNFRWKAIDDAGRIIDEHTIARCTPEPAPN